MVLDETKFHFMFLLIIAQRTFEDLAPRLQVQSCEIQDVY